MLRLSELLERIRPAGAPGAAAASDEQRRHDLLAAELTEIMLALAEFEREAEQIVDAAQEEAEQLRSDGERRAARIRAGLADRVAVARAEGTEQKEIDEEHDAIVDATRRDIDQLRRRAEQRLPALSDTIVESIWSILPESART